MYSQEIQEKEKYLQNQPQLRKWQWEHIYLQPKVTDKLNGYKNKDPYISCLQETQFRPKDTYRLSVRGWKNIFHANGKQNKAGVAILISDKIDLKIKKIVRDKEGHYIIIKGSI